jgi:hypothetical protein
MGLDLGAGASYSNVKPAKKVVKVKKPKATHTVRRTSGGGGGGSSRSSGGSSNSSRSYSSRNTGGGGGGGGGGGSSYSPPKKSKPKIPSLDKYLGTDSVYQSALSGSKRSLTDFISELGRRKGEANTQFTQTKGSMERDRTVSLDELRQEFASRGLIQSGLYGEEQGKFQQKFTEQMQALQQQQAALLADLLGQQKNYTRENDLANQQAKQEALLRRAQKYNIGA